MASERAKFEVWCEYINNGEFSVDDGQFVCEDPDLGRVDVDPMNSSEGHAGVWDYDLDPITEPDGFGLWDSGVFRDGDQLVLEGNTGPSGRGNSAKVVINDGDSVRLNTGANLRRGTTPPDLDFEDLPTDESWDRWNGWLEENFVMDDGWVQEPR